MSLWNKLFGGSDTAEPKAPEPEMYKDYAIFPEPIAEGNQYRLGARVEKEVAGELKIHQLVRADTFNSKDAAADASIHKARVAIDQMGDRLFA